MTRPPLKPGIGCRRVGRICVLGVWLLAGVCPFAGAQSDAGEKPVSEMSLEDLIKVQVAVGTLGGSAMREVPATVTTITSQDIKESGARNLDELLEIYVPNMLYLRHNW